MNLSLSMSMTLSLSMSISHVNDCVSVCDLVYYDIDILIDILADIALADFFILTSLSCSLRNYMRLLTRLLPKL